MFVFIVRFVYIFEILIPKYSVFWFAITRSVWIFLRTVFPSNFGFIKDEMKDPLMYNFLSSLFFDWHAEFYLVLVSNLHASCLLCWFSRKAEFLASNVSSFCPTLFNNGFPYVPFK